MLPIYNFDLLESDICASKLCQSDILKLVFVKLNTRVDKMGIGEMGVGEQASLKHSVNWLFVQEPAEKPLLKGSVCWQF